MDLAFVQNIGPMELVIIFFVVLIFFGAKRLPSLFASFGKSIKEFKKATQDIQDDINTSMDTEPRKVTPPRDTVVNESTEKTAEKQPAE